MKATKIIQVVLVILALALIGGAAAWLLGVFDNDGGGSSGGGGGSGGGGSSNTETVAPNDTEAVETYIPSEGNVLCSHTMDGGKVVTAATCAAEGTKVFTCTKCGYTEEAKISKTNQHTYKLKTYTENEHMKYCTVCNNSTVYEEHTLTENILKATCTTTGSYIYSCACGYKHTQSIEPLGHLVTTWTNAGDSHGGICTRDGCGQYVTAEHTYGSEITVEATCTAAGSKTQTCRDCGATKRSVIPILTHTEVSNTTPATCTTEGVTVVTCSVCHTEICRTTIPATGHTEVSNTTAATCTTDGVTVVTCSMCGTEIRRTTIPAGHTFGDYGICTKCDYECEHSYDNTPVPLNRDCHSYVCSLCGNYDSWPHELPCDECGATEGMFDNGITDL